jgi:hypothetical protein
MSKKYNGIVIAYNNADDEKFYERKLSKNYKNIYSDLSEKDLLGIYTEIIDLTVVRKKYNISMGDIFDLYKMMNIVSSDIVAIHSMHITEL